MFVAFFRTLILYLTIVFGIRLMGKRQLGELQPSDLVITIIISNIATLPIEEIDVPLFMGLLPILTLVVFEVIVSSVSLRFPKLRQLFSGSPVVVIRDGVIDQKKLRELRFSVNDLLEELRSSQIFDVSQVDFALVETTGKLSVYQKYQSQSLTPQMMGLPDQPAQNSPPYILICDGEIYKSGLELAGKNMNWLKRTLEENKTSVQAVYLMTAEKSGKYLIVPKEGDA